MFLMSEATRRSIQAALQKLQTNEAPVDPVRAEKNARYYREELGCFFEPYALPLCQHHEDAPYPGVCQGMIMYHAQSVAESADSISQLIGPMRTSQYHKMETCRCTGCGEEFPLTKFREQIDAALDEMDALLARTAHASG